MELDVRVRVPDKVVGTPAEELVGRGPHLLVDGIGAFVRCLLPVHLTGGMLLTFGTWLSLDPDDLHRAREVWRTADYPDLELTGGLANAIKPWGQEIFAAPMRVAVRDPEHIPYIVESSNELLGRVITEEWDRDWVLGSLAHALPVPIQRHVTAEWSVERGAGFTSRIEDDALRFVAPGRTVIVDAFDTPPEDTLDDVLAVMLEGAPADDGHLVERTEDELRHAFWVTSVDDDRAQHELYGMVLRRGTTLQVTCIHDDPDDHEWALHTWRSVTYHG